MAAGLLVSGAAAQAATYEVTTRNDIVFAEHDGTKLLGDLYFAEGPGQGAGAGRGAWRRLAGRQPQVLYATGAPYLARNGVAVFAIEYRLMKPGVKTYPGAVYDTKAAIQYVRAKAAELGVDPERIGLIGDCAGAHLSALVALAGEEPLFSSEYRSDANAAVSAKVKAVVGFYGVYDMQAQWQHDLLARPRDNIGEKFLGAAPHTNRKVFFEASPISYATVEPELDAVPAGPRHRRRHRRSGDAVRSPSSTRSTQAGFFVRTGHHSRGRALLRHRSGRRHELRRLCRTARAAVPGRRAQMKGPARRPDVGAASAAQNL